MSVWSRLGYLVGAWLCDHGFHDGKDLWRRVRNCQLEFLNWQNVGYRCKRCGHKWKRAYMDNHFDYD